MCKVVFKACYRSCKDGWKLFLALKKIKSYSDDSEHAVALESSFLLVQIEQFSKTKINNFDRLIVPISFD